MTVKVAHVVSPFEARLLRALDMIVRRRPVEPLEPWPGGPAPRALSRAAITLVQNRLTAGCVALLARWGWRRQRSLRDGTVVAGRLWERHPPAALGLSFSPASIELLLGLAAGGSWSVVPRTPGDRLLRYLAFGAFGRGGSRETRAEAARDGLIRLAFADSFLDDAAPRPEFAAWLSPDCVWMVEALQPELAARWDALERSAADAPPMRREPADASRERALDAFLSALETADRRDLALFLLKAPRPSSPALLKQSARLRGWARHARTIGYFDEGYAAAQFWQSEYERLGGTGED